MTARIVSNFCDLNELKSKTLHKDISDIEIDCNENSGGNNVSSISSNKECLKEMILVVYKIQSATSDS